MVFYITLKYWQTNLIRLHLGTVGGVKGVADSVGVVTSAGLGQTRGDVRLNHRCKRADRDESPDIYVIARVLEST